MIIIIEEAFMCIVGIFAILSRNYDRGPHHRYPWQHPYDILVCTPQGLMRARMDYQAHQSTQCIQMVLVAFLGRTYYVSHYGVAT